EVVAGFYDRTPGFLARGKATRLRAATALLALLERHGITWGTAKHHLLRNLPAHPLVLKKSSNRRGREKVPGTQIRFQPTPQSEALEAEVRELNKFIDEHELLGGTHRGYRRIFNCGDRDGFEWNKGGRLYSQGDDSYQRLKKEERLKMTIDGEPVAEIDITASYLTILHARGGVPIDLSRDPYSVEGLPRAIVKAWVTMTLGHDKF